MFTYIQYINYKTKKHIKSSDSVFAFTAYTSSIISGGKGKKTDQPSHKYKTSLACPAPHTALE
jgi:hypothetical protein